MKLIYLGVNKSPSFYVVRSETNIRGFSQTIEVNDVLIFDTQLQAAYRVTGLTKRDYKGKFLNQEDAKNSFFDATVERLTPDEVKDFKGDHNKHLFENIYV